MATSTRSNPAAQEENSRFPDGFRILQGKQEYVTYRDHSSIRVWYSEVATHYDYHQHSAIEVIMPRQGMSVYRMPDRVFCVEPGQILFIPSECPHELTETENTCRYLFLFEPNPLTILRDQPAFELLLKQPLYLKDDSPLRQEVTESLNGVVDAYMARESMWNARCYAHLVRLYASLGTYLEPPEEAGTGVQIDSEIMNGALTYINEHYMDDISLDDVALFAGFSRFYFSRMFKQFAGCSYSEYLTRRRMNVATELLIRTGIPIQEVAEKAGFGSLATFNRVFRGRNHCTPTQYRAVYGHTMRPEVVHWLFPDKEEEEEE